MAMNQKTRSLLTLLALLVAVGGAGLFAYYGVYQKQEAEKQAKEKKEKLFDFDRAKAAGLTVTAKGQTTVLAAKKPEGWEVVSPVQAEADQATVDGLLDQLLRLRSKMIVEEKASDLAKFGLDKPALRVVVRLEDGKELTLRAGAENAFDNSVYVAIGDSADVIQAEGGFKAFLAKDTFELRDKQVVPFEEPAAKKLSVRVGANRYELEKQAGHWQITSPIAERADDAAVSRILGALRSLRATKFATDTITPAQEATYGLSAPRLEASLTLEGGGVTTLLAGEATEDGEKKTYARRREAVFVAEVPASLFTDLDVAAADLRDRTVLSFDKDQVEAVRFGFGDETVTVERAKAGTEGTPETWKVTQPAAAEAKGWKISTLLWTIGSLKASGFAAESPTDLAKFGLDRPAKTVTVVGAEGKELGTLSIGKEEGDKLYVRSTASPRVFEVEKGRLSDLPASLADLEEPAKPDGGAPRAAN